MQIVHSLILWKKGSINYKSQLSLSNVLYVPKFPVNLLSVSSLNLPNVFFKIWEQGKRLAIVR